jgi:hypothetical protein
MLLRADTLQRHLMILGDATPRARYGRTLTSDSSLHIEGTAGNRVPYGGTLATANGSMVTPLHILVRVMTMSL